MFSHRVVTIGVAALIAVGTLGIAHSQSARDNEREGRRALKELGGQRRPSLRRGFKEPRVDTPMGEVEVDGARISAGRIKLHDVLRFITHTTGKPVIPRSSFLAENPHFGESVTIDVLADIDNVTPEIAMSMLVREGYVFYEETMDDGRSLIHVGHLLSRTQFAIKPSREVIGSDEEIPEGPEGELITAFVRFESATVKNMGTDGLYRLLGLSYSGKSGVSPVGDLVITRGSNWLLVKGKRKVVRHVRELVEHMEALNRKSPHDRGDRGK